MKVKCEYCGTEIDESEYSCYVCGTLNKYLQEKNKDPETISELKKWYERKNLPDETITRFFIGVDYKSTDAYGIYKDAATGIITVYENTLDGQRKQYYSGKNEQEAVKMFFQRLKEKTIDPKEKKKYGRKLIRKKLSWKLYVIFILIIFVILFNLVYHIYKQEIIKEFQNYYEYEPKNIQKNSWNSDDWGIDNLWNTSH